MDKQLPTTHSRVKFTHEIPPRYFPHVKQYVFTSVGRHLGSYERTVTAFTLVDAREKLREQFPNAVF